jgi:bifunctional UDP-N-acetylglucosamine pyrophosphorylase/glucosamine-1-phosphate N-acetyltransferase
MGAADEQLGTAHAVMQAMPKVGADADVLILYGDVPLMRAATLQRLLEAANGGLAVLTAEPADPAAYGRVVRDGAGRVARSSSSATQAPPSARSARSTPASMRSMRSACRAG